MKALRFDDLRQHTDILRLRNGQSLTVRFVEPRDAEALQNYFRSLSVGSRYNRFLGAMRELPQTELGHFTHPGEDDRFSVIALMTIDGFETIVGEARYGFEPDTASFEFGLSIDDRWQGQGIGSALLRNLECRAAAFGAERVFGDTLRSNEVMLGVAAQIRLRLRAHSQRLEAGALRKTYRCRAAGYSLCKLEGRRVRPRHEQSFGELSRHEVCGFNSP